MGDNPRGHLKWLEQQLLNEEAEEISLQEDADLLRRVDALIGENPEEAPLGNFGPKSKGARAEQARIRQQAEEPVAVLTKTKKQLHQEEKLRKKAKINRKIGDLVLLAILECIGILVILGWWLQ